MGQLMPNSDAKVFEIKIKVNGSDAELRPAMTTSNTIQTNSLTDTLFIPIESVFSNDSMSFVYLADGIKTKQIIETGEENENYIVVRQGLTMGQQVYLTEPENAESYELTGMEIYADILRKKEEEKARKAEEEKQRMLQEKPVELPQGIQVQGISGGIVISK